MDRDQDCSYKRVKNWTMKPLILPNPAAQNMIYAITWSRIARKLTNTEFVNLS